MTRREVDVKIGAARIRLVIDSVELALVLALVASRAAFAGTRAGPTPTPELEPRAYLPAVLKPRELATPSWRLIAGRWDTQEEAEAWGRANLPGWMEWEAALFYEPPEGGSP